MLYIHKYEYEFKETQPCPRLSEWDALAAANFRQDKKSFRTLTAKGTCTQTLYSHTVIKVF